MQKILIVEDDTNINNLLVAAQNFCQILSKKMSKVR